MSSDYEDDYDYDSAEVALSYLPQIMMASIGAVLVIGATTSFYLILYCRAISKGIPSAVFWKNICCCGYCSGWSALSTIFMIMGGLVFLPTTGVGSAAFWWAAPFVAAWNWIDSQSVLGTSDSAPLMQAPFTGTETPDQTLGP